MVITIKEVGYIKALTNNLLFCSWVRCHTLPSNFRIDFTFLTQQSRKWLTITTVITLSLSSNHYPSYLNTLPVYSLSCPSVYQSLLNLFYFRTKASGITDVTYTTWLPLAMGLWSTLVLTPRKLSVKLLVSLF